MRTTLSTLIALSGFALLWVAQFVGHRIEGKRPSFLADLQFLLVGPAWVLACIRRRPQAVASSRLKVRSRLRDSAACLTMCSASASL